MQFALNGFTPTSVVTTHRRHRAHYDHHRVAVVDVFNVVSRYSATLLVIAGSMAQTPASEWDLNPETIMVPAGGSVTLQPKITSGTANLALGSATSDSGITVSVTQPSVRTTENGAVTVTAGSAAGFYHYTVAGADSGASQTQSGWIVVGKPAATADENR